MTHDTTDTNTVNPTTSLAFDVYGTLIDTNGVVTKLSAFIGELAPSFANTWRDKQLEYSFRRGLMKQYQTFAVVTQQALDYSCAFHKVTLSTEQKEELLAVYKSLPAFADVVSSLIELRKGPYKLYAFSNGNEEAVEGLLIAANIRKYFDGIVSVDPIKTFKPNPDVYQHFIDSTDSDKNSAWLVSSNPFDVIGAVSSGLSAAWLQRTDASIYDPWGIDPTITINRLTELSNGITNR